MNISKQTAIESISAILALRFQDGDEIVEAVSDAFGALAAKAAAKATTFRQQAQAYDNAGNTLAADRASDLCMDQLRLESLLKDITYAVDAINP